jgi:serine/threonine protein kinase
MAARSLSTVRSRAVAGRPGLGAAVGLGVALSALVGTSALCRERGGERLESRAGLVSRGDKGVSAGAGVGAGSGRVVVDGSGGSRFQFELRRPLSKGSFGTVCAAHSPELGDLAVKVVQLSPETREVVDSELSALATITARGGHDNVVKFRAALTRSRHPGGALLGAPRLGSARSLTTAAAAPAAHAQQPQQPQEQLMVFELIDGQELYERVAAEGPLPLQEVKAIVLQLARALRFLHRECRLAHGDIKPENVLIERRTGAAKLVDFGSAVPVSPAGELLCAPGARARIGTVAYCAPELYRDEASGSLTPAIDVFSLGCLLYVCVTGQHPFDPDCVRSDSGVSRAILHDEPSFEGEHWERHAPLKALLQRMLDKDPAKRISAHEIVEQLESSAPGSSFGKPATRAAAAPAPAAPGPAPVAVVAAA